VDDRQRRGADAVTQTNLRPDLDDIAQRLANLASGHRHAAQEYSQAIEQTAGFQVLHLDVAVDEMNPQPREIHTDEDRMAWMGETLKRVSGGWHVIERAASGHSLDSNDKRTLELVIERLKPAAERVYEDLRLKLATTPPPPAPARVYWQRVGDWVQSSGFQLLGGACLSTALAGVLSGQGVAAAVFFVLFLAGGLLPPALASLPAITFTRASIAFTVVTTVASVVLLVAVGLGGRARRVPAADHGVLARSADRELTGPRASPASGSNADFGGRRERARRSRRPGDSRYYWAHKRGLTWPPASLKRRRC
jgi:hypothetical protein